MKKKIVVVVFFVMLLAVGIFVYLGQRNVRLKDLYYSGTIEAKQAELGFQISGRIREVVADEGESVKKGQTLAVVDESEYRARYEQAEAHLEGATKNLEKLELLLELYKRTFPEEVARAEAGVRVLHSQLQELEAGSREQDIERARLAFLSSRDVMEEASKNKARYDKLFEKRLVSEKDWDTIRLKYETSLKNFEKTIQHKIEDIIDDLYENMAHFKDYDDERFYNIKVFKKIAD